MWTKIKTQLKRFKIWIIGFVIGGVALAAGTQFIPETIPSHIYQKVVWTKPITDAQWAEDVKEESLNFKLDFALDEMEQSLAQKLPKVQKDLDKFIQCPECIRFELKERFTQMFKDAKIDLNGKLEGKTLQEWIDEDFASQLAYYQWKTDKITQSLERIAKEKDLRKKGLDRTNDILFTQPSTDQEMLEIKKLKQLKGL
jgi:hypothetical protein